MAVKYQIFVSSTYEDLRDERDQVIKAILEMGHLPVGMEMFSAADEEQWKLIARQIDECDYYVVIIAHRYGSMEGEISYTEKEYNFAIKQRIPTLGFVIDEAANWPKVKMDSDPAKIQSLNSFKDKVKVKSTGIWKSADDLYGKVSISLMKEISVNPRIGWIRASEISLSPATTTEFTRLSKENADLRKQLAEVVRTEVEAKEEQALKTMRILRENTVDLSIKYKGDEKWSDHQSVLLYDIFAILAPQLMPERPTVYISMILAIRFRKDDSKKLNARAPIPVNYLMSWLSDLSILGLVEPSKGKHLASDEKQYWTLSEFGRLIYGRIRLTQLETGLKEPIQAYPEPTEDPSKSRTKTPRKIKTKEQ